MAQIFQRLKALYAKEGGAFPDPILKLHWPYKDPGAPKPDEIAREINGYVVEVVKDPNDPSKLLLEEGKQLATFPSCATTARPHAAAGSIPAATPRGQHDGPARQFGSGQRRPLPEMGVLLAGQSPHPLQPRVLRHQRQALGSSRKLITWDGQMVGLRRAGHPADGQTGCGGPSS